ncbi:Hypothetical protein D9617_18g032850 [Elsinoe fawcettii]|nr:Hypothetical protein D9617_18g032850 [Elsinoe fawcettii]
MWSEKADPLSPIKERDFAYIEQSPMILPESRGEISTSCAKDFSELLSGPTVDIFVGKDKRRWSIHRNLLVHHSAYFETAFMGAHLPKSKQANQTLELLKDDPAGFELFVKWLYQGRLDDTSAMTDDQKYEYAVACHKLYLLCERFDLPDLKNMSVDQYRQCLNEAQLVPDAEEINDIYKISPKGSPFRKLMTQIAARQIMDPDTDKDAESYRSCFQDNPDFAVDMVNAIKTGTGGVLFEDPTDGDDCEYHDHENGAACRHRPRVMGMSTFSLLHRPALRKDLLLAGWELPPDLAKTPEETPDRVSTPQDYSLCGTPDHDSPITAANERRLQRRLTDEDLLQMLKASSTTSTDSDMSDLMMEQFTPEGTLPPPPTPAKPTNQVKAKQMELVLSSAMGSMDNILKADRAKEGQKKMEGGQEVVRIEGNPLNYVAALRLLQEKGRRNSRDLFDGLDG